MTPSRGRFWPNWTLFWRRLRNSTRTIFARGDFSTLLITCGLMVIPVMAMSNSLDFAKEFMTQSGAWPVSLSQLVPIAILSVVFGFLLARSHYSELTSLLLSAIYNIGTILLVQFFDAPGNVIERIYGILSRFVNALGLGVSSTGFDPFLLIIFLSVLVWFLGHNTAWHTFRLDRVWRAILPPGIVLVLNNLYNTSPQTNIDGYLIVYMFLALLLIIRSHIEAREYDWYANRIAFRGNMRTWFFRLGALLSVLMLSLAWLLPTGSAEENAKRFQQFLNEDALTRVLELFNRLFGTIEGQGVVSADYYGGDRLVLGGAIQLGDQIVMAVQAPPGPRYYWKSRVFDTYDGGVWTSARQTSIELDSPGLVLSYPPVDPAARREVEQRFLMVLGSSNLVYAAPQPLALQLPVKVEVDYIQAGTGNVDPSVVHPVKPLERGDTYSVISSVSTASAAFLRSTGIDYPAWVTAKDLQVPPTLTQRTRDLAFQIMAAAGAQTPYDKAKAIERWLRANINYNEAISNPPPGKELIDWMLFEKREAYCTYYASAMIMMLRSQGIPARMAAGFAQGLWNPQNTSYLVRERDAHTWVEVYFPGAGWVEFEPTSAQQAVERPEAGGVQPTSTPTPTPTPSPSPTFLPTATHAGQQSGATTPTQQPAVTLTPTLAPIMPSPTPTATPTAPPPPSFLDLPPPVQDFLSWLLAIAAVVTALSFGGIAYLWWTEYRGLDRLSPVGRAYARLGMYARRLGLSFRESNTPLERGRRIAREMNPEGRSVIQITDAYIGERYGLPHEPTLDEENQVDQAWKRVRKTFIGQRIRKFLRRK